MGSSFFNFLSKELAMPTFIHQRVRAAQKGENPTVICKMLSGWAVIGDRQFIPGYCLLLADPVVPDLNALTGTQRSQYLSDMAVIGDALLEVTDAYRINYEILGNSEPALHAHIFPRYMSEPEEPRSVPVWVGYTREENLTRPLDLDRDRELMEELAAVIQRNIKTV
jgi:diadenosine tetraphosphate (Ap4A) HIT family hydrolase